MTPKQRRFMLAIHTELNMRRRAAEGHQIGFATYRQNVIETDAARTAVQHEIQEYQLQGVNAWTLGPLIPTSEYYDGLEKMENATPPELKRKRK